MGIGQQVSSTESMVWEDHHQVKVQAGVRGSHMTVDNKS